MDLHAFTSEMQPHSNDRLALTIALEAQIETQKTTIASLRGLLEQHKVEIDSLRKCLPQSTNGKKENVATFENLQAAEAGRRLRMTESKMGKLASEVCNIGLCLYYCRFTN